MAKSNINTMTAFLLIAVIIGIGVFLGSAKLTSNNNVVYYDWDNNNDLSLANGVTIFTPNGSDYKSITFDSNYNLSNMTHYLISFKDKVNISNVDEFTLEYRFTDNIKDSNSSFVFGLLDNEFIKNGFNDSFSDYVTYHNANSQSTMLADDYNMFGQSWITNNKDSAYTNLFNGAGFDFNRYVGSSDFNYTTIKLKFNNVDKYLIITKIANGNEVTSFYTYDNLQVDISKLTTPMKFDLTDLVLYINNELPAETPTSLTGNDSMTIDYVKLTYVNSNE